VITGSDNAADIGSAINAGKNAVENNYFTPEITPPAMMDYGQQAASLGKDLQEKGYSADDIQLAMIAAGLIPKPDNMSKEAKDVINFLYEQIPGIGSERALADAIKSGNPEDLIYVVLPILKGINSIKPMDKTDPVGDFIKSEQGSVPLGKGTTAGKVDDVVDAGKGTTGATSNYSGDLVKVNKPDPAADALAQRIGGESRVRFANDGREFDTISDLYVAQSKPALQQVNKSVRDQMKATFEAAKETNRSVYYHFEGQPSQSVINKLNEYSNRYGVKVVIDTKPLNPTK
jgi:hypothetical protein